MVELVFGIIKKYLRLQLPTKLAHLDQKSGYEIFIKLMSLLWVTFVYKINIGFIRESKIIMANFKREWNEKQFFGKKLKYIADRIICHKLRPFANIFNMKLL